MSNTGSRYRGDPPARGMRRKGRSAGEQQRRRRVVVHLHVHDHSDDDDNVVEVVKTTRPKVTAASASIATATRLKDDDGSSETSGFQQEVAALSRKPVSLAAAPQNPALPPARQPTVTVPPLLPLEPSPRAAAVPQTPVAQIPLQPGQQPTVAAPQASAAGTTTGRTTTANNGATAASTSFPFDSSLLEITAREDFLAKKIKKAIEADPELESLSDLMCAQLAIASTKEGDLDWAIGRAYKMQRVRRHYKIRGTYEEGTKAIKDLLALVPGLAMSYTYNPHTGRCILVMDPTRATLADLWKEPRNIETTIRGGYYICLALVPSLECTRVGGTHVFEMEGYPFTRGLADYKNFARLTNETHGSFPTVIKEARFYHTPSAPSTMLKLATKFMPPEIGETIKVGYEFSGGRLSNFYNVPTAEAAAHRAYVHLCSALKLRMESEKVFVLEEITAEKV